MSGACSFSLYHRFYSLLTKGPSALFLDLAQAGPFSERAESGHRSFAEEDGYRVQSAGYYRHDQQIGLK
jgi:hypothetical protein